MKILWQLRSSFALFRLKHLPKRFWPNEFLEEDMQFEKKWAEKQAELEKQKQIKKIFEDLEKYKESNSEVKELLEDYNSSNENIAMLERNESEIQDCALHIDILKDLANIISKCQRYNKGLQKQAEELLYRLEEPKRKQEAEEKEKRDQRHLKEAEELYQQAQLKRNARNQKIANGAILTGVITVISIAAVFGVLFTIKAINRKSMEKAGSFAAKVIKDRMNSGRAL